MPQKFMYFFLYFYFNFLTEVNPLQVGTKKLKSRLGIRVQDLNVLTTRLTRSSNSKTEEQKKARNMIKVKPTFVQTSSFDEEKVGH